MLLSISVRFMGSLILQSGFLIASGVCCCVCLSQARGTLYENMQHKNIGNRALGSGRSIDICT